MKIRHPLIIKLLALLGAWIIRAWIGTLRYEYRPQGQNFDPNREGAEGRYIYTMWHEYLLLLAYQYGHRDVWVLISQHADGELIAQISQRLGFSTVRGSSTRGGIEAVRQMLRLSKQGHLGLTPDGPRGPRRRVQLGLIYLAARTGLPIVPIGCGFERPWRMKSWDRFALPRPWSRSACITGHPIHVPADADMEKYRQILEDTIQLLTTEAEKLAGDMPSEDGQNLPQAA